MMAVLSETRKGDGVFVEKLRVHWEFGWERMPSGMDRSKPSRSSESPRELYNIHPACCFTARHDVQKLRHGCRLAWVPLWVLLLGGRSLDSNSTSMRLSFLICKMGTLGAAPGLSGTMELSSVAISFVTRFFGRCRGVAVRGHMPSPRAEQVWAAHSLLLAQNQGPDAAVSLEASESRA